MKSRGLVSLFGALALAASLPVQASSISLQPSQAVVQQTLGFTVNLLVSAADAPGDHPAQVGGLVVIDFDPALLSYDDISLVGGATWLESVTIGSAGGRQTLTFGFENAAETGAAAQLAFTAIGPVGSVATINIADADDFSGSFANYAGTDRRFYPDFIGTSVEISAVPLPGAAWLLVTAFGAVLVRARAAARRR